MDGLIAQTEKYDNVVSFANATPDKAFTDDVLKRLAEMNKKFILFFDNDKMGQKSANMLCEKMKEYGIEVYNYQSDKAVDLMEFLKQGGSLDKIAESL